MTTRPCRAERSGSSSSSGLKRSSDTSKTTIVSLKSTFPATSDPTLGKSLKIRKSHWRHTESHRDAPTEVQCNSCGGDLMNRRISRYEDDPDEDDRPVRRRRPRKKA